jgi:hypothetical protein
MKFDLLNKDPLSKARARSTTADHGMIETRYAISFIANFEIEKANEMMKVYEEKNDKKIA